MIDRFFREKAHQGYTKPCKNLAERAVRLAFGFCRLHTGI
jgi:hypothetical protein